MRRKEKERRGKEEKDKKRKTQMKEARKLRRGESKEEEKGRMRDREKNKEKEKERGHHTPPCRVSPLLLLLPSFLRPRLPFTYISRDVKGSDTSYRRTPVQASRQSVTP